MDGFFILPPPIEKFKVACNHIFNIIVNSPSTKIWIGEKPIIGGYSSSWLSVID
jgi:hypothetical protein